jgi:hypothetical protein
VEGLKITPIPILAGFVDFNMSKRAVQRLCLITSKTLYAGTEFQASLGIIILMSSASGRLVSQASAAYGTAQAATLMFMRHLAQDNPFHAVPARALLASRRGRWPANSCQQACAFSLARDLLGAAGDQEEFCGSKETMNPS